MKKLFFVRNFSGLSLCLLMQLCFPAMFTCLCLADDKNGVSPNTISLPSGPGSIEGLGESFQPMLNTGTARYSVNIALPPGAGGHSPKLPLNYESGNGDGPAGIGWKIGPGAISRKTDKGIPRYVDGPNHRDDDLDMEMDEADEEDILVGLEGEELVRLDDHTYRARIEGTFLRYTRVDDHWVGHLKDGTELLFGATPETRVTDSTGEKVFKWLLEKSTDTNGNVILFQYATFPGSDNRKYLKEIRWGPGPLPPEPGGWDTYYFAHLTYEDRPDWRKDYRSGFLIKTEKRLAQVDIGVQGVLPDQCAQGDWNGDSTPDALIRRYTLSYEPSQIRSFLTRITRYGANGISYLPPISFSYSVFSPEQTMSATGAIITSNTAPATVMDSDLVDLIDLNQDGLPDLFQTDFHGAGQTYYLNLGVNNNGDGSEIKWDEAHAVTSPDGLAMILHLADEKVHLADVDGNGISDLIHTPYSQEVYYYLNQGNGSWGARKRMSILDTAPPAPFTNDDVKTSDLDFDKRMDVVMSTDNGYTVWFNLEEGKYSRKVLTAGASYGDKTIRFSDTAVHLADLNGDRMSDVARIRMNKVIYCANMGYGHFDTSVEIAIPDAVLTDSTSGQVERAKLEDINGDGLADLVVERAQTNDLWYWLNLGTDTFSGKHVITNMPGIFGSNMVIRWADINGNGTTDLIYADSTATSRLMALDIGELAGGSAHANLLTGIDNGLGIMTEITYKSSTEYYREAAEAGLPWFLTIPFPVTVISRVKTTTGLDVDMTPGVDEYVKTFNYRDGFYEDREKAFRGFAQVTVTELGDATAPTQETTYSFFTGGPDGVDNDGDNETDEVSDKWHREEDALKGLVKSVEVAEDRETEDKRVLSREENDWLVRNLTVSTDDIEVRFAYNQETKKLIYEGTATPETLRTTFGYDNFGNVTEEKNYGALSITGDEAFTFTEYINDTNLWILGLPQRQYVTNESLQIFSETRNYYDGADYIGLSPGQVTVGHLTRQEGWVEGSTYINLVRNAYDGCGNIIGILDPNGNQRTITYDSAFLTYPIREDIEVGGGNPDLTVVASYNLGLCVVTSSTGFNGHETTYGHDTFGRLTSIVRPGDSAAFSTLAFSYTMSDPEHGLIYSYDPNGSLTLTTGLSIPSSVQIRSREIAGLAGTFDTIQYTDGMGRSLASVEEGSTNFIVKDAVLFDGKGSVYQRFLPYSSASWDYAPPVSGTASIETRYDATGRTVLTINPPDAFDVVTSSSTDYAPLSQITTDDNGNSKNFFYDGLERLVEVHEHNQGETYISRYAYDCLGNLLQITDAQNNVKTVEYDGLSRKTAINDPDRGRMEYTYDGAGNVIQTIDNKGQTIVYAYDGVNRIITEDYLDGQPFTPDVAHYYDTASPDYPGAQNTGGKLSWVEDLSGGTFYSHDPRGNVTWSVKRVTDAGRSEDFFFSTTYDAMNRVVSTTYPDGDQVNYTYNNRALLDTIPGIVTGLNYFPSGQLESIIYENGLKTTYAYDPRNRMTGLVTDTITPAGNPIQNLSYTFDGVSNITAITDNRTLTPGSPENATQDFLYDDLYRLIHAQGPGYGAIDFDYDKIGNMIFKRSPSLPDPQHIDDPLIELGIMTSGGIAGTSDRGLRLPGDSPGPHAITSTESGLAFDYDDNGNMTNDDGNVYEWDFLDRLKKTTTTETVAEYAYDSGRQRVIKKSQTDGEKKVVYYPGKGFEIRDGKPIKYVFDGIRRVARMEGRSTTGGDAAWQVLNFRHGWNFFSLEVEPDDPAIASVLAPLDGKYTEVWAFDAVEQAYKGYIAGQGVNDFTELHAQQGYIIHVTTPAVFMISGIKSSNVINLESGWNLIPCPTNTPTPIIQALSSIDGKYDAVWDYDTGNASWRNVLFSEPAFLNTLNMVQPGKAYWIYMKQSAQLGFNEAPEKIYFYHPDHLGSSSVVTNDLGAVVERTEFYPFGRTRHHEGATFNSAYKYTGKEMDIETGLMYYGARYYGSISGAFVSPDPMDASDRPDWLVDPQKLNVYAYVQNRPLIMIDPTGKESKRTGKTYRRDKKRNQPSTSAYALHELVHLRTTDRPRKAIAHGHELVHVKDQSKRKIDQSKMAISRGHELIHGQAQPERQKDQHEMARTMSRGHELIHRSDYSGVTSSEESAEAYREISGSSSSRVVSDKSPGGKPGEAEARRLGNLGLLPGSASLGNTINFQREYGDRSHRGPVERDLLLRHELTHVVQQRERNDSDTD